MNPILLDVPEESETERLTVRIPRPGDGAVLQAAYVEAGEHVHRWVAFVNPKLTVEEVEETTRKRLAKFITRERFGFHLYLKGTHTLVGEIALHDVDWEVPKFELGYYVRPCFEGQGYCSEAVEWITRLAFERLGARRVEMVIDPRNERSVRVAERAGYALEGTLGNHRRGSDGKLADSRIYAKTCPDSEIES